MTRLSKAFLTVATAITILGGCAVVSSIPPESLRKPATSSEVTLNKDIRHEDMNGVKALVAGKYVAEYEDADGVFYRGPIQAYLSGPSTTNFPHCRSEGGLWISKNATVVKYRMYFYRGSCVPPTSEPASGSTSSAADSLSTQMIATSHRPIQAGVGAALGAAIAEPITRKMWETAVGKIVLLRDLPDGTQIDLTR